jgi:hypothetical protein
MSQENVEIVRAIYEAVNKSDVWRCAAPNALTGYLPLRDAVHMKRLSIAVLALGVAVLAATSASAAAGGNAANAKLCQKDGWKTLYRGDGSTFVNQGDCVSYGAQGNTILLAPNFWKATCEQDGGAFSISNTYTDGVTPLPPGWYAYVCSPVSFGALAVLAPLCSSYPDFVTTVVVSVSGIQSVYCLRSGTT